MLWNDSYGLEHPCSYLTLPYLTFVLFRTEKGHLACGSYSHWAHYVWLTELYVKGVSNIWLAQWWSNHALKDSGDYCCRHQCFWKRVPVIDYPCTLNTFLWLKVALGLLSLHWCSHVQSELCSVRNCSGAMSIRVFHFAHVLLNQISSHAAPVPVLILSHCYFLVF